MPSSRLPRPALKPKYFPLTSEAVGRLLGRLKSGITPGAAPHVLGLLFLEYDEYGELWRRGSIHVICDLRGNDASQWKLGRDSGMNDPGARNSGLGRSPPTFRYLPPQNSDNVKDTTQLTLQVVRQVLCHKETAAESTSSAMHNTT